MKKTKWIVLGLLFLSGCGGAASKARNSNAQITGDLQRGLELCAAGEFDTALEEFQAVAAREKSSESDLRVGFGLSLVDRYPEAVAAYRKYLDQQPDLAVMDRREIEYEIDRIEKASRSDEKPKGENLASRRLRGELAKVRAEQSLGQGDFEQAFRYYRTASQYIPDPNLALEAALAATKCRNFGEANVQFSLFLGLMGDRLNADLRHQINAEIDRIRAVMQGDRSVSAESLADRIYASRKAPAVKSNSDVPASEAPRPAVQAIEGVNPQEASATRLNVGATAEPAASQPEKIGPDKPAEKALSKREERLRQKERLVAKKIAERAFREAERKSSLEREKQGKVDSAAKEAAEKEAAEAEEKKRAPEAETSAVAPEKAAQENIEPQPRAKPEAKAEPSVPVASLPQPEAPQLQTRFDQFVAQLKSPSSATRGEAVRALTAMRDPRVEHILEDRMLFDTSIQVRMAAVDGLVARKSMSSIPYMRQALMTVSNSSERSKIRMAIRKLMGTD